VTSYSPLEPDAVPNTYLTRSALGIQAGVLGGAAMLVLVLAGSLLRDRPWWEIPNLAGSTFYGIRAFRSGVGRVTLSGIALHFVVSGTLGVLFGLAFGSIRQRKRVILLGLVTGLLWYYFGDFLFWSRVNPWISAYAPQPLALAGHAVFGLCLGFIGQRMERPKPLPNPLFTAPAPADNIDMGTVKDAVE
jgi:hypothetical protein